MPDPVVLLERQRWPQTQPSRRAFRPLLWFWAGVLMVASGGAAMLQVLGPPASSAQSTTNDAVASRPVATSPQTGWTLQPDDHGSTPAEESASSEAREPAFKPPDTAEPQRAAPAPEHSMTETSTTENPVFEKSALENSAPQSPAPQSSASAQRVPENSAPQSSAAEKSAPEKSEPLAADASRQVISTPSARRPVADPVQLALGRLRRQQRQQQLARGPNDADEVELGRHDRPDPPRFLPPPPYYWPYAWAPNPPSYRRWQYFP